MSARDDFHSTVSRHHINHIRFTQMPDCHMQSDSSSFHTVNTGENEDRETEGGSERGEAERERWGKRSKHAEVRENWIVEVDNMTNQEEWKKISRNREGRVDSDKRWINRSSTQAELKPSRAWRGKLVLNKKRNGTNQPLTRELWVSHRWETVSGSLFLSLLLWQSHRHTNCSVLCGGASWISFHFVPCCFLLKH